MLVINLSAEQIVNTVLSIIGTVFMALLFANGFFIKRLISKLDSVEKIVNLGLPAQTQKINHLEKHFENSLNELKNEVKKIGTDMKEVSDLKVRIGILEHQQRGQNGKASRRERKLR